MASLFNFGFVRKRAAESQQRPSGPAVNEEDREDVEILSPSQPATSSQPEQNSEPETKRPRRHVSIQWIDKKLKTYAWLRFDKGKHNFVDIFFSLPLTLSFSVCVFNFFSFFPFLFFFF